MNTCAVEDCDHAIRCRGWCKTHYDRWWRWGDPLVVKRAAAGPPMERFFSHVDVGDCWIWTGALAKDDYGTFYAAGRSATAHRWLWTTLVGPVPAHLQLDHLCRNPPCVNPDHLEVVTPAVNVRRGLVATRMSEHRRTLARAEEARNREPYCPEWALDRRHASAA